MSFNKWGSEFDGAYTSPGQLEARAGVYVVWCKTGESWTALDVGEAGDVRDRLEHHDRKDCWRRYCPEGTIYYAATYTPKASPEERMTIEAHIRDQADPCCGVKESP